jgi:O-antigen/teichoic acid export membrane protein
MTDVQAPIKEHRGHASWVRSLASGSAHLFGATLLGHAGFFVAVLVLTRALLPSERGTVAFIVVAALIAARIALIGLADATLVFASTHRGARPRLLTNLLLATTLSSLVVAVVACSILAALPLERRGIGTVELLLLGSGVLVTNLTESGRCFLLGCSEFRAQALVLAVWPWSYAGLLLAVVLSGGLSVAATVGCWAASSGAAAAALILIAIRGYGLGQPDAGLFGTTVHFGVRAWAVSASRFLNFRADQILMGFLATEAALGTYAVAVNASEALLYLPFAIGSAIVPVIGGSDESKRGERTLQALRALLLTTTVAVVVAAFVGPTLLPLVFGAVYEASVIPFLFLLPGALGFAVISVVEGALIAARHPGRASIGFVVALVVGLCLDLALIPWLHATGAAVAASVALIVGGYASIVSFRRTYPVPWSRVLPGPSDLRSLLALARAAMRRQARTT